MHVIYLLLFEWEFILIINCARYTVTGVGNRPLNLGKQSSYIYHDRVYYIYLYSWCTIKTTILQSGLFLSDDWCLLSLIQPLSLPRPKTPFQHVVYLYNEVQLSKGHLGSRGGKHLKTNWKTPVSSFQWQTSQFLVYFVRMRRRNTAKFWKRRAFIS